MSSLKQIVGRYQPDDKLLAFLTSLRESTGLGGARERAPPGCYHAKMRFRLCDNCSGLQVNAGLYYVLCLVTSITLVFVTVASLFCQAVAKPWTSGKPEQEANKLVESKQLCKPVLLGEVDVPSGELLILDPGLARFWQQDGDPRSPKRKDPDEFDLRIVGPDAIAAGRAYDRQFDPRYLFDVENVENARKHFSDFVNAQHKNARLDVLPKRISHLDRARLAMDIGDGAGVVQYNKLWAVAVRGLPTKRALPIFATPMPDGEFAGRWRSIDIVIDSTAHVSKSLATNGVMVEHGQLICADLKAFGAFRMWHSLDGQADFVFWGHDAANVAQVFHAEAINRHEYGWRNLPLEEIGKHAQEVQEYIDKNGIKVAVDYRPHCNLERLNAQIRNSELEVGQVLLDHAKTCGFSNRWGDGIFEVIRDYDAAGRLVRIRIDVGSEQRQTLMRRVKARAQGAIVTKKILADGQPIRFAERLEPSNPDDSGWAFSAGTESEEYMQDAKNLAVVSIALLLQRDPALETILDAPFGSLFRRTSTGYVPDV